MIICKNHSLGSCAMKNNGKIKVEYCNLYISAILPITGKHNLHTFLLNDTKKSPKQTKTPQKPRTRAAKQKVIYEKFCMTVLNIMCIGLK